MKKFGLAIPPPHQNNRLVSNSYLDSGRTLVEMLSVLAIMGVLSLIGLYSYRQAIAKMHANKLIYEANKRATVVSTQIIFVNGKGNLNEFTTNEFGYGTFPTGEITPHGEQFDISITGVAKDICQKMQNNVGGMIVGFAPETCTEENTIALTYNNDLSETPMVSNGSGSARTPLPEDGPAADDGTTCSGERKGECQVCNNGVYIDSDAYCLTHGGGSCIAGECKTLGCTSNGDCRTIDPDNCGNGECFCHFKNNVDNCTGPLTSGTCTLKSTKYARTVTLNGRDYIIGSYNGTKNLDWYSAKNFCAAYGQRMMTLAELGCTTSSCPSDSLYTQIYTALGGASTWALDESSNCRTYYVSGTNRVSPCTKSDGYALVYCH